MLPHVQQSGTAVTIGTLSSEDNHGEKTNKEENQETTGEKVNLG